MRTILRAAVVCTAAFANVGHAQEFSFRLESGDGAAHVEIVGKAVAVREGMILKSKGDTLRLTVPALVKADLARANMLVWPEDRSRTISVNVQRDGRVVMHGRGRRITVRLLRGRPVLMVDNTK